MTNFLLSGGQPLFFSGGSGLIRPFSGVITPPSTPAGVLGWDDVGHSGPLTAYNGPQTITTSNVTIENAEIVDTLFMEDPADNLVVRNSHIHVSGDTYAFHNDPFNSPSGSSTFEDCTFEDSRSSQLLIGGSGTKTFTRCRFRNALADLVKIFGSGACNFNQCYFGPFSRSEFGSIDVINITSPFSIGEVITGSVSNSNATLVNVVSTGATTATLYYRNANNGTTATRYFVSPGEMIVGNQGGAGVNLDEGSFEDIHSDQFQNSNSGTVTCTGCTWDAPPAAGGLQVPVNSGSWLESDGISSAGGVNPGIYYKASIGFFSFNSSSGLNIFDDCHFVRMGSNGIQHGNGVTCETRIGNCKFYPSGIFSTRSGPGNGSWTDQGGNIWAETGNDLQGDPHTAGDVLVFN